MKRILLPALLALASTAAFAQATAPQASAPQQPAHHMHHQHDPHMVAMHLSKKLNLTPDQTAKLEPVLVTEHQKMEALKSNASLTPQQMHEQRKAIHADTHTQLAGILTPDQLQQVKAMHHGHGHHGAETAPLTPTAAS